ncbi:Chitoporin [Vibrio stylophorae]|uniref:Chitoporin n=1 Tax=Vibrio stylophorae TaxID=659351 RepID=A0ABN8DSV1_9VIBR|nr:porin [Vibrio stylophorae]CAH0534156.1 Chitoporin [Vibrio stylophorae]
MEKMFKRTLLGAAVALAATSANAAIELNGQAVQLYGQAAASYQIWTPEVGNDTARVEIESRFGIKGTVEFDNFAPNFIYQMETGNWDTGSPWGNSGLVGGRDTWVGFDFEGVGSIKYGRQLDAVYTYVDWPHTNPGLGVVFEEHNTIGLTPALREDHMLRFDSATWGGFNFQVSAGGMQDDIDALRLSLAASYTNDMFSVHAGHYSQGKYSVTDAGVTTDKGDQSYSLVGGSVFLGPVTLTAGYKMMENNLTNDSQDAVSATAQYVTGSWLFKAGYAHTFESDKATADDSSTAMVGRVLYMLPSTAIYVDVRNYDMLGDDESRDGTRTMFGVEYYF